MDPFGESGPDEPEEFDPDSLGPDVPEAPDVEPDLEDSFDLQDVDEELATAFWGAAFFLNVAIAALAIGLLLIYFRGDWRNGAAALLAGTVAAVFAARYYFGYTRDGDGADKDSDDASRDGGED